MSEYISRSELNKCLVNLHFPKVNDTIYTEFVNCVKESSINSKLEVAMFLAHLIHESGGFQYKEEINGHNLSHHYDSKCGYPGQSYHGRGYIMLSHSYNYRDASRALFRDDTLLRTPDIITSTERFCFQVSRWFWDDKVHDVVVKSYNFEDSIDAINGGLEVDHNCPQAQKRKNYYRQIREVLHI